MDQNPVCAGRLEIVANFTRRVVALESPSLNTDNLLLRQTKLMAKEYLVKNRRLK